MGHHKKTPSYPGVQNFSRPSVRPCLLCVLNVRPRFFNVRPRFSMSVRVFFNARPSVSINPTKNKQKSTKTQNDQFEKRRKRQIRYFRIAISTTPFLTRMARFDRSHRQLSIRAMLDENGDV